VSIDSALQRIWYQRGPAPLLASYLLWPLSMVFAIVAQSRRTLYRIGVLPSQRVNCPVIVVGNITVGGTGKTPFVIWLVEELRAKGFNPAVITRGYGGQAPQWPQHVTPQSDPHQVGDEAVLIATRTLAVVVAGPDRVADAQLAINLGADIVICDDGLQHYRLQRDAEIVLIDAERGVGNGRFLPAGPLREGVSRLSNVSAVVLHQRGEIQQAKPIAIKDPVTVSSSLGRVRSVATTEQRALSSFLNRPVHAVAGIGHPEAFFTALRAAGLEIDAKALPDHAVLTAADISYDDAAPVLMTEKDAVKCRSFADARCWSVELTMTVAAAERDRLLQVVDNAVAKHRKANLQH
jgi:tetraacyldisaccharide 4'-kinase